MIVEPLRSHLRSDRLEPARRADIAPFMVMDVMSAAQALAASGREVLHLEVGEPGAGPPRPAIEAARRVLDQGAIGYTVALGLPALRQGIARHYQDLYALEVGPERVVVTAGGSGAFVLAFLSAFEAGDRVIVPEPAYPCYKNVLHALGIEAIRVALGPETAFRPTPEGLDQIAGPVHGLVLGSPANPTGTMLGGGELKALAAWCDARRVRLIVDEIYHGLTYGAPADTILAHAPGAIVVNGFSKYFAMTGWRIGWIVAPPELVRPIELLSQNLFICASTIGQHAALAALGCRAELDRRIDSYRTNREILLEGLERAGLVGFAPPDGAFYIYVDVSALTPDSAIWSRRLLDETGVALTPGADFDRIDGHRYVRLAFCGDQGEIERAAGRLVDWIRRG